MRPTERIKGRFHEDAGFLASNLLPEHTGVDGAVVWIFAGEFSRTEAQCGPRVLVVPGRELASRWVETNQDALLQYWQGEMATDDTLELLARVLSWLSGSGGGCLRRTRL